MDNASTHHDHIAELRAALEHAIRLLGFSAGREAATDPQYAARLLTAIDDLTGTLNRTDPESTRT